MERNYDKPYRGLPTEIRLEIWKLLVPETGIIQEPRPMWEPRRIQFPKLQSQLLRLNQEMHNEILPIFKKTIVKLLPEVDFERHWTQVSLALRSHILESFNWYSSASNTNLAWNYTNPTACFS